METSSIKQALTTLCLRYRWSYGVFWRFHPRNSMLLCREDAYVKETFQAVIDEMLLQVQMLGEGTVGKAALDGKHRWVVIPPFSTRTGCNIIPHSQDNSDLSARFCAGIQTVAVIPVESCGVLEFGSTHEIPETPLFLDQSRQVVGDQMGILTGLGGSSQTAATSLLHDDDDSTNRSDGLLDSVISSYNTLYSNTAAVLNNGADMCTDTPVHHTHHQDLKSDPIHSSSGELFDVGITNERESSSSINVLEGFDPSDILQWVDSYYSSSFPPQGGEFITTDDLFQTMGMCSELGGNCAPPRDPCGEPAVSSSPSCVTNSFKTATTLQTEKVSGLPCVRNSLGLDNKRIKSEQLMEEGFLSDKEDVKLGKGSGAATLQSSLELMKDDGGGVGPAIPRNLFSELGLSELLSSSSNGGASSSSLATTSGGTEGYQFFDANKRRKLESFSWKPNSSLTTPTSNCQDDVGTSLKKCFPNSQVGLWVNESYSSSCITTTTTQSKVTGQEPSKKGIKKRAKPGEGTRPRPKDRQLIQDRIKELRDLIPNCSKCSIDSLLGRTIKHMVFLQGMTNFVDNLKQVNDYKAARDESIDGNGISSSAAWAVEVDGQNPIIVEDIGHSGLMLIEMLCEEQGLFLEIAEVIRGFGLTVLKGVIEARDDKTWAHFIAEANGEVTRIEVLMRLVQLFQEATTSTTGDSTKVRLPTTMMTKAVHNTCKATNHMSSSSSSSCSPTPSPSQLRKFHQPLRSTAITFGLAEILR